VIEALFLSLGDLGSSRILGVLIRSLIITLLIFLLLGIAMGWLLVGSDPCSLFRDDYACVLGGAGSSIGAIGLTALGIWFLFPAVALGVICAYVDRIAAIIEERHYPAAAANARPLGLGKGIVLGLRSGARVLIYNLLALPLYVILLFTGIGPLILFAFVNGIAFGRDLGELVAARHGDRPSRRAWLRASRGGRMAIGAVISALFMVPVANLLAPILGAAMTAHFYHRMHVSSGKI